jgi:hypothetical protein
MQLSVVVVLISMMTGNSLQERHRRDRPSAGTKRTGYPGDDSGIPHRLALSMKIKRLLCREQLRQVTHQFSWIDQSIRLTDPIWSPASDFAQPGG